MNYRNLVLFVAIWCCGGLVAAQPAGAAKAKLSSSAIAKTHVLFIDLNNAEDEVTAITASLPSKAATLTVVPPLSRFSEKRRELILKTKAEYDKTATLAEYCTITDKKKCPVLWEKMRALEVERERLTGAYGLMELVEDLRPLSGRPADIVVISGHHSKGFFRGEIAELEVAGLIHINDQFPNLFRNTRTVILLGCETGTPEMFTSAFPQIFPNASLLIGAEDNAPTRSEARNLSFIEAVVSAEPKLHAARDAESIGKLHRQFLSHRWPVTILWRGQHFFAKRWNGPIWEAEKGVLQADIDAEERRISEEKRTPKKKRREQS